MMEKLEKEQSLMETKTNGNFLVRELTELTLWVS